MTKLKISVMYIYVLAEGSGKSWAVVVWEELGRSRVWVASPLLLEAYAGGPLLLH